MKAKKIKMILDDKKNRRRNLSVDFEAPRRHPKADSGQIREGFNRNMVNILYDQEQ